jgi:4-hydroxybenzoate polyprenyltransferase
VNINLVYSTVLLVYDFIRSLLYRMDAWGVAFVLAAVALRLHDAIRPQTVLLAVAIATMYWFGYALNDYFDAPFDAQDTTKSGHNFFVAHPLPTSVAQAGAALVILFPLAAFAQFALPGLLLLALFVLVAWGYSAPPLRLKSRPGLDLLVHAVFVQTYPYLVCLLLVGTSWEPLDYALLAINFFSSLAGQLQQQIRDFVVDSKTDRNFATRVGLPTTRLVFRVATVIMALLCLATLLSDTLPLFLYPLVLIALPTAVERW